MTMDPFKLYILIIVGFATFLFMTLITFGAATSTKLYISPPPLTTQEKLNLEINRNADLELLLSKYAQLYDTCKK